MRWSDSTSEAVLLRRLDRIAVIGVLGWTVLLAGILYHEYRNQYSTAMAMAREGLKEAFNKDVVYRKWAAGHGGVYVPVTEKTPPNPYLSQIPDRDIETSSRRRLTLINPAYMTRQVQELGEKEYGFRGHITSLNPIRPENAPDEWERQALRQFEHGAKDAWAFDTIDGQQYVRFMSPFAVEEGCLKCHGHQGYKVGDVRGGISISAPWGPFEASAYGHVYNAAFGYFLMWLLGVVGTFVGWKSMKSGISQWALAEREIVEAKNQWEVTFDALPDIVAVFDLQQRIVRANRAMAEKLGLTFEQLIGKRCYEIVHGLNQPVPDCPHLKTIEDGKEHFTEIREPRLGATLYVSSSPLFDASGQLTGTVHVGRDITELKALESDLTFERRQLLSIFDSIDAIVTVIDPSTYELLYMNHYAIELAGKDGTGSLCHQFYHGYDAPCPFCDNALIIKLHGQARRWENPDQRFGKNFITTDRMIKWPDGRNVKLEFSFDISDRKRAEEALRESTQRYQDLFEKSRDGFVVVDAEGRFLDANEAFCRLVGYSVEELRRKKDFYDITPERWRKWEHEEIWCNRLMKSGVSGIYEKEYVRKDGTIFPVELQSFAVFDDNGTVKYLWGIARDITATKKHEKELQESEARFRDTFEYSTIGKALVAPDGKFLMVNRAFSDMIGYPVEEMLQLNFATITHPEDVAASQECIRCLVAGEQASQRLEKRFITRNKEIVWADVSTTLLRDDAGKPLHLITSIMNITDRKQAEQELEESEARYRQLADVTFEGIFFHDHGVLLEANDQLYEMVGYQPDELLGTQIMEKTLTPESVERVKASVKSGSTAPYVVTGKRKDGTTFPLEVRVRARESLGRLVRAVAIRDVSDRKALEAQLLQAQKMEAVGTLAGGIAHDFNNLLQVVCGYSEILLASKTLEDSQRESLKRIQVAGHRGAELVKNLMTFSRRVEPKIRSVDLNQEVVECQKLLSRTIPKTIRIDLSLGGDIELIMADPSQIGQILMNLGVNARDAMPDGGRLGISTAMAELDQAYCDLHPETKPGRYVVLSVSDSGVGMDKETLARIFDPFFSTKEKGKGTGLGLAIVYGIVKQHQGHITCYSEFGVGTTFRIYFPLADSERGDESSVEEEPIKGGSETILLVDDDEVISDIASNILKEYGYTVITACDGREALAAYQGGKESIALIILDLIMPEMDGKAFLKEILGTYPDAKVLIASGYSDAQTMNDVKALGAKGFVEKPFNSKVLLLTVRQILDEDKEMQERRSV